MSAFNESLVPRQKNIPTAAAYRDPERVLCLDSEGALSGFSFQLIGLPVRVLSGCLLPSYRDVRTRKARIRAVLVVTNHRARCVAFCADDSGRPWTEQGRLCALSAAQVLSSRQPSEQISVYRRWMS